MIELFHPRDTAVPKEDAIGYLGIAVDGDLDPVPYGCYFIPVEDPDLADYRHPPTGAVIQYPMDDLPPHRVGPLDVPDHVQNWDYREEGRA